MELASISALATGQLGLVSTRQLTDLGITADEVRTLLRRGWLERVAPRVLGVAGAPESPERSLMAGLLCLGPSAIVSHEAAARLHRFDRCVPDAVEFSMPRRSRGRRTPFRVHTTDSIGPLDRITIDGFRCTSATRTIIDLARARIPKARLEAAIDSAVRSGATAPVVLAARLGELRGPGRWGAPRLDDLLLDSGGHTILERRFLTLMRTAGLPQPTPQVVHRRNGKTFARVDFLFDGHGVVVEVSGRKGHASDAERSKDAQRRNELQDIGRKVYEYTYQQVIRDPSYVVRTMRARLGQ